MYERFHSYTRFPLKSDREQIHFVIKFFRSSTSSSTSFFSFVIIIVSEWQLRLRTIGTNMFSISRHTNGDSHILY